MTTEVYCRIFENSGERAHDRAHQIWVYVIGVLMHRSRFSDEVEDVPYGDISEALFGHRQGSRGLFQALGMIAAYCEYADLPPLNVVVVRADSREPGVSVMTGKWTLAAARKAVLKYDWLTVQIPTPGTFRNAWSRYVKEFGGE